MARPLVAEINLSALRHNYQLAVQQAASPLVMAVIKANAYGHGAVQVAQALTDLTPAFGVSCIEEAEELRLAGISNTLVLLEGFFSGNELPLIIKQGYELVIHSPWQLQELLNFFTNQTQQLAKPAQLNLWLKVDSGMHRLGFSPAEVKVAYQQLKARPEVGQLTLISHLACADELTNPVTQQQLQVVGSLQQQLGCAVSLANSPATLAWPETFQGYLRPGLMLYGVSPFASTQQPCEQPQSLDSSQVNSGLYYLSQQLQSVMTLKTRLISIKEVPAGAAVGYGGRFITQRPTKIGVAACGYGDGYPRQAQDGTPVLVDGHLCELAGRVSMDMLTIDLSNCPQAHIGSEVILWGGALPVNKVAKYCSTISYTLLTGVMQRVKRIYLTPDQ